jgi:hypothetical protein
VLTVWVRTTCWFVAFQNHWNVLESSVKPCFIKKSCLNKNFLWKVSQKKNGCAFFSFELVEPILREIFWLVPLFYLECFYCFLIFI